MNAVLRRFGMALLVVLGCSGASQTSEVVLETGASSALSDNAARTITILHVNDSHSVVDSIGPRDAQGNGSLGGLTRAATIIQHLRAENPNSLFLHGGDAFEGDLTFLGTNGVLELQLLRQLGVDAFTLGNHEFDYGPDLLAATLADADFDVPILSANLTLKNKNGPHPLASLVTDRFVKDVGGVRVGIFGLTTPYDPLAQTGPFELSDKLTPIVRKQVAALRVARSDVVILLSHLPGWVNREIAAMPMNGIDFIIAAHDESEETFSSYTPGQTAIVQAGHFYQKVGQLAVTVQKGKILAATHGLITVDGSIERLQPILEAVQGVEALVNGALFSGPRFPQGFDAFHTPVAQAATDLANLWTEEMGPRRDLAVGSLAADALKQKFAAQLGVTTSGFLNDKIYQGPVVANDLFRALPYGINPALFFEAPSMVLPDPVLKVTVNGAQLYTALAVALENGEIPQVSDGTRVCFDLSAPEYQKMRFILIDGVPIEPATPEVSIAMNIIIWQILNEASQGAGLGAIALPEDFDPSISQFSALLEYATGKVLSTPAQPRVKNLPGTGCDDWLMQLLSQ